MNYTTFVRDIYHLFMYFVVDVVVVVYLSETIQKHSGCNADLIFPNENQIFSFNDIDMQLRFELI